MKLPHHCHIVLVLFAPRFLCNLMQYWDRRFSLTFSSYCYTCSRSLSFEYYGKWKSRMRMKQKFISFAFFFYFSTFFLIVGGWIQTSSLGDIKKQWKFKWSEDIGILNLFRHRQGKWNMLLCLKITAKLRIFCHLFCCFRLFQEGNLKHLKKAFSVQRRLKAFRKKRASPPTVTQLYHQDILERQIHTWRAEKILSL